jgi:F-type H+-transporting ATPase subunit delta
MTDLQKAIADAQPDVSEQRLARVYAEALLNLCETDQCVPEVLDELRQLVGAVLPRDPTLEAFFTSGAVGRHKRADVIQQAFKYRSHPLVLQFLLVLNEHDRLFLLRDIVRELGQLNDRRHRRFPVQVRTAVPLPEDQQQRLVDNLRKTFRMEPIVNAIVDPNILGGMILRVGDWLFDGSVRNRLDILRKQLVESSSHEIQTGRDRFSNRE